MRECLDDRVIIPEDIKKMSLDELNRDIEIFEKEMAEKKQNKQNKQSALDKAV